jgi:hypothetical protein
VKRGEIIYGREFNSFTDTTAHAVQMRAERALREIARDPIHGAITL